MSDQKYVRPTMLGWLTPAMLGPWISTYAAVSAYAAFGPEAPYIGRWGLWGILMVFGSLFAATFVLMQVIVDVLLLAVRQRILPTGLSGWKMSLASPVVVLASYVLVKPHAFWKGGPWSVLAALLIPMAVVTIVSRVALGQKVQAKR